MRFKLPALTILLAAAVPGCSEEPEMAMSVGGVGVPTEALARLGEVERQGLADLIGFGLAVATGRTDSLGAPLVERAIEAARVAAVPFHLGAERLGMGVEDLERLYLGDPEWELEVRHLVRLTDGAVGAAARAEARRIAEEALALARAGEDFGTLAGRYSEEPGATARGGLLQPGRRGSWVAPFWEAAVALSPGETSGVVETEYGFHVLRLDERRPVPFAEADRSTLLARTIPREEAAAAMEEWVARNGALLVDPPAVASIRRHLLVGEAIPDTLVVARGAGGGQYGGADFSAGWAALSPEVRAALEGADEAGLAGWIESDAREIVWAALAREMQVAAPADAGAAAELEWRRRVGRWAQAFNFREGLADERVRDTALQSLLSGAQEARAARAELRSLRPRLRQLYPVVSPPS